MHKAFLVNLGVKMFGGCERPLGPHKKIKNNNILMKYFIDNGKLPGFQGFQKVGFSWTTLKSMLYVREEIDL